MNEYRAKYPREYRIWKAMRARCYAPCNKNMGHYQKNGIIVCKEWNSFQRFIEDMGPCPESYTIDRINNNGNYEPSNCRWASMTEQSKNRGDFNKYYTYNGKTMCLKDWAREFGIKYITLQTRTIRHPDYSFEQLLSIKPQKEDKFILNGKSYTRDELCSLYNFPKKTFYDRYHKGWSIERIFNTPIRKIKNGRN